ncbi:TonB-dependent receptor [Pelomyxa schiedti]|nr:TonB-dependent receptor [Pelomyxa schiedti]
MPLVALSVSVTVTGFLSCTQVSMRFRNPSSEEVAGNLVFPVPEGSTVCGYAVDIDGKMVRACVCPKEVARVAFETGVRERKGAPSICEHVAGNVFKVRVFPFAPDKYRTVWIEYTNELHSSSLDPVLLYLHEFNFVDHNTVLDLFQLHLEINQPFGVNQNPWIKSTGRWFTSFLEGTAFRKSPELKTQYILNLEHTSLPFAKLKLSTFVIHVPTTPIDVPLILLEQGSPTKPETFFCIKIPHIEASSNSGDCVLDPIHIGIFWDCSRSRHRQNLSLEYQLINFLSSILPNSTIDLYCFHEICEPPVQYPLSQDLFRNLEKLTYDGGTDLSSLPLTSKVSPVSGKSYSFHILFSDGFSTVRLADNDIREFPVPIFSVSSSVETCNLLMKSWSHRSSGMYFNLLSENARSAALKMCKPVFKLLQVSHPNQLEEVYPKAPTTNMSILCGKISTWTVDSIFTILLYYGTNATSKTIQVDLDMHYCVHGSKLLARHWAQRKIEDLELDISSETSRAILKLGQEYAIVTENTSLIVLDSLEQYLKYDIEPDEESLPEIHRLFEINREQSRQKEGNKLSKKKTDVQDLWLSKMEWFNNTYDGKTNQPHVWHFMSRGKHFEEPENYELVQFPSPGAVGWLCNNTQELHAEQKERKLEVPASCFTSEWSDDFTLQVQSTQRSELVHDISALSMELENEPHSLYIAPQLPPSELGGETTPKPSEIPEAKSMPDTKPPHTEKTQERKSVSKKKNLYAFCKSSKRASSPPPVLTASPPPPTVTSATAFEDTPSENLGKPQATGEVVPETVEYESDIGGGDWGEDLSLKEEKQEENLEEEHDEDWDSEISGWSIPQQMPLSAPTLLAKEEGSGLFEDIQQVACAEAPPSFAQPLQSTAQPLPLPPQRAALPLPPQSAMRASSRAKVARNWAAEDQTADAIEGVMNKNIDHVLQRGLSLEDLVEKSEDLSLQSQAFYKQAARLRTGGMLGSAFSKIGEAFSILKEIRPGQDMLRIRGLGARKKCYAGVMTLPEQAAAPPASTTAPPRAEITIEDGYQFSESHLCTIGVDFSIVKSGDAKFQIWDTAGNERFRTITTAYYRSLAGVALMYDITDIESFNDACNTLDQIKQNCTPPYYVVLLGNKLDIEDKRQVSYNVASEFAAKNGLKFFEISCKNLSNVVSAISDLFTQTYLIKRSALIKVVSLGSSGVGKSSFTRLTQSIQCDLSALMSQYPPSVAPSSNTQRLPPNGHFLKTLFRSLYFFFGVLIFLPVHLVTPLSQLFLFVLVKTLQALSVLFSGPGTSVPVDNYAPSIIYVPHAYRSPAKETETSTEIPVISFAQPPLVPSTSLSFFATGTSLLPLTNTVAVDSYVHNDDVPESEVQFADSCNEFTISNAEDFTASWEEVYLEFNVPSTLSYEWFTKHKDSPHSSTLFYLACGRKLLSVGAKDSAVRILTSILDISRDDHQLQRAVAYILEEHECWQIAQALYKIISKERGEEPQSYFDLLRATYSTTPQQFDECTRIADIILTRIWDPRFTQVELPALMDLHCMQRFECQRVGTTPDMSANLCVDGVSRNAPLPLDILVRIQWAHDPCDVSLCVSEPTGENCHPFHNHTKIGGLMSRDFPGNGPVQYMLKRAITGRYDIRVKLLSPLSSYCPADGRVPVKVTAFAHYGEPSLQKSSTFVILLKPSDTEYQTVAHIFV